MATFQVVDEYGNYIASSGGAAGLDVNGDTYKAVLSNVAPTKAGTQILTDITQIAGTGGYAAVTLANTTWAETGGGTGIWQFSADPFTWTASGADFATARYVVIYDDTPTAPVDPVVGYADLGSFVLANGFTLTITPGANGIFRLTVS